MLTSFNDPLYSVKGMSGLVVWLDRGRLESYALRGGV